MIGKTIAFCNCWGEKLKGEVIDRSDDKKLLLIRMDDGDLFWVSSKTFREVF